jgi:hypothetical protein
MNLILDKKGADKIISIYWFIILTLIAGGVFAMAYSFYGSPYDVREIESEILTNKIADCISYRGLINSELLNDGVFDEIFVNNFLKECNLNFNTQNEWEDIQFFSVIEFYNFSNIENPILTINNGNINFIGSCDIKTTSGKDYEKLVKCNKNSFYAVDNSNNQYLIKIISGVRKAEKNVKL